MKIKELEELLTSTIGYLENTQYSFGNDTVILNNYLSLLEIGKLSKVEIIDHELLGSHESFYIELSNKYLDDYKKYLLEYDYERSRHRLKMAKLISKIIHELDKYKIKFSFNTDTGLNIKGRTIENNNTAESFATEFANHIKASVNSKF